MERVAPLACLGSTFPLERDDSGSRHPENGVQTPVLMLRRDNY